MSKETMSMAEQDPRADNRHGHTGADDDLPPELRAIAQRYAAQPVPRPTTEDTARLVARLLAEEPAVALATSARYGRLIGAFRVARWRMHLLGRWFWVAGVILMALGAVLTSALRESGALPLILLAPLTAVLSLAHAVRTPSRGLRAVEASCPIGFVEVTTGLVLAIVGFDCLIGVMATAGLALLRWAPFVALLAAWLGPLLLLAGISLPIALRWGAIPASLVGGGPWLLLAAVARLDPGSMYGLVFTWPRDATSVLAHAAAAFLGLALLLLTLLRGPGWRSLATSGAV
jgi:hypothetical protein